MVDEQGLKNTVRYSAMLTYGLANERCFVWKQSDVFERVLRQNKLEEPLKIASGSGINKSSLDPKKQYTIFGRLAFLEGLGMNVLHWYIAFSGISICSGGGRIAR
ncbi:hypothetical protein CS542_01895 [Pedobacter sp. IW39]|nr:hypothetical protein CS542_01895 [Pedobacter sp. IW39]